MGNLYGSEYWTYLLPRRVGEAQARAIMAHRLPFGTSAAKAAGLIDDYFGDDVPGFRHEVERLAQSLAQSPELGQLLERKRQQRLLDERQRPLEDYRREELEHMKLNFYGFDPSYHVARYHLVHKVPHSWTPLHLAQHRAKRRAKD
jgi:putative two-component system hydrogenase maturation factor HypX/HoxX